MAPLADFLNNNLRHINLHAPPARGPRHFARWHVIIIPFPHPRARSRSFKPPRVTFARLFLAAVGVLRAQCQARAAPPTPGAAPAQQEARVHVSLRASTCSPLGASFAAATRAGCPRCERLWRCSRAWPCWGAAVRTRATAPCRAFRSRRTRSRGPRWLGRSPNPNQDRDCRDILLCVMQSVGDFCCASPRNSDVRRMLAALLRNASERASTPIGLARVTVFVQRCPRRCPSAMPQHHTALCWPVRAVAIWPPRVCS